MPTKPVAQPEPWATNANYTTGPFIGSASKVVPAAGVAAEGHRPGANFPTAAEHENSQQNRISALARWLFLGSFNPDADAHVVETDAGGRAGLFGLDVTNTLDAIAATFTNNAAVNFPVVTVTGTGGTTLVQADPGNSDGICFLAQTKLGSFPVGFRATMAGSGLGSRGVQVTADAATDGVGVAVRHEGAGTGIEVTHVGTPFAGAAVVVTANGPGATRGLDVVGCGARESLRVRSPTAASTLAHAIFADMLNTLAFAVHARTAAGALASSRALRAEARGAAIALEATSVNGDAIVASASSNTFVALRLPGKAVDPTDTFGGRLDYNTTTGTWVISDQDAATYRDLHATRGGIAIGTSTGGSLVTNNNAAVYATASTLVLTGQSAPRRAGVRISLRFVCDARTPTGVANTIDVRIADITAAPYPGTTIVEWSGVGVVSNDGYALPSAVQTWQRTIDLVVPYIIPVAGDRTFIAEVKPSTANGIQVRDCRLEPYGSYT